ncbi:hypothetical protein A2952_00400 [Candidatus Kaiserbacteria bacterium RIFCSPLOWO2_01_FULL_59_34]|nr:MAG: hypothetical protein A2766_03130 [Candidatus Kaiserbacteria bacterium RIFCSPHIGHO2_01_FULL_58_22]OGG79781.1 MAG: hypothetical protein A2952_00400 [Candidatus Kaiserbacteria bacterium RIFCSPLOWO2_01_FULL_59_34]OGG86238.1 MAG: hypothetical protein A3I47_03435 [Candidatus Kaiserbacteria bacterium RIFCSPLOWO2_02_FULL_59_19]
MMEVYNTGNLHMITKAQLQEKLVELAKKAQETGDLRESMSAYLAFIKDNYNDLDSEAKIIGDKAFEILGTLAKETLEKMPDSIEKRKMTRMHASAYGDHWDIESIAETLEKPTHLDKPILKATEEFFLEHTQMIADLMHDVLSNNLKGPDAAILALYCSAIDELIVAFHLAQHAYGPQVLSHVRAVYEIKDKIELFSSQPEHLQLWASDDPNDAENVRREYSAAGVRKKLGKERYDPVYSFLSEMGTHSTMKYVQSKILLHKPQDSEPLKREAKIWVGGSPREDHLVVANTGVVQAVTVILASFVDVYKDYLHAEEGVQMMKSAFEKYKAYMVKYFCDWMEANGTDSSKARAFISSAQI